MMDEIDYENGYRQGLRDAQQIKSIPSGFWVGLIALGFLAVAGMLLGMT